MHSRTLICIMKGAPPRPKYSHIYHFIFGPQPISNDVSTRTFDGLVTCQRSRLWAINTSNVNIKILATRYKTMSIDELCSPPIYMRALRILVSCLDNISVSCCEYSILRFKHKIEEGKRILWLYSQEPENWDRLVMDWRRFWDYYFYGVGTCS